MLVEETAVHLLECHVKAPEVAVILGRSGFGGLVDNSELQPVGLRRFDAHEIEQLE